MESNNTIGDFEVIRFLIRSILYISSCSLILSAFITLIAGIVAAYGVNFFSIFFSVFALFFSTIVMLIISIYKKIKHVFVWEAIKKEAILIVATGVCLAILALITNFVAVD